MEIKEAIEVLRCNYPDACYLMLREAVDIAIFVLEKEIEKAPVQINESTWYSCPVCGDTYIDNYCGKCGQKIKW